MLGGEYKKESKDGLGFSLHWYYTDDDCEKTVVGHCVREVGVCASLYCGIAALLWSSRWQIG